MMRKTDTVSDDLLGRFSEFITVRFGLHSPARRRRDLARKLLSLCYDFGFADPEACTQWLISEPLTKSRQEILVSRLTVGETYFFRDRNAFDALESQILPPVIEARRNEDRRLRIWSAGCSTGEEAYSVAILLQRLIPDLHDWRITILATDLNSLSLSRALHGEYGEWSFRGTPKWFKDRYFQRTAAGRFRICDTIGKMVTFAPLNLATDTFPSMRNNTNAMDIIFCRNVLMYFSPEQAGKVVEKFRRSLLPGGYLLVSPCEVSPSLFYGFETVYHNDALFYRKQDGDVLTATVPPAVAPVPDFSPAPGIVPGVWEETPAYAVPSGLLSPPASENVEEQSAALAYERAMEFYKRGDYGKAIADLAPLFSEGADVSSPFFAKGAALMAQAFANQGNSDAAVEWMERAITADKLNPRHYYLRAMFFQERGDDPAAISSLKKAIYLDGDFVLAYFALGNLTLRTGKRKEAAKHLKTAASLLEKYSADDVLPGSDGLSARRLSEIIGDAARSLTER